MNVNVEELKQKFPVKDVPPYGNCIVVPGTEFNPDWEAELGDQGFLCAFTDLDQKAVTLVRLGKKLGSEPAEREVPRSPSPALPKYWSPEEDEVLVKLWNEGDLIKKMTPSFPGRTEAAIRLRIQRLEKHGRIEKRTGRGRQKLRSDYGFKKKFPWKIVDFAVNLSKSKDPAYSTRDIAKKILEKFGVKVSNVAVQKWIMEAASPSSVEKSADTPVHAPVNAESTALDKLASDVKGILDVLDVQGRVLDKLSCALLMQAVEVKQEKGDLSIPPGLWIHYANALLQEDKQYREKFQLKVEQLLEAST